MRRKDAISLLSVAALLVGCAVAQRGPTEGTQGPRRAGYRVAVEFTSGVPDRYEVLSGPMETYRTLAINDRLRALLAGYTRDKSDEASGRSAQVLVHLERVSTAYRQLGQRSPPPGSVRVVPASFGDREAFDRDDDSRPEEIRKTASVMLTAEVRVDGRTLLREPVAAEVTEVTQREDIDAWAYDYTSVVDAALREAVAAVDALVDRALGQAK